MKLDDFFDRIGKDNGARPNTHVLEPPLSDLELETWRRKHPGYKLPDDLLALLRRANGFRLDADDDSPTGGAVRLYPLREFNYAARTMYDTTTSADDLVPESWVGIMQEPAMYVVLDTQAGRYLEVDPIAPDEPSEVGTSIVTFLDWLSQFLK